jgi:predicted RNase H-like nuclease (RuvC/YqgF family)
MTPAEMTDVPTLLAEVEEERARRIRADARIAEREAELERLRPHFDHDQRMCPYERRVHNERSRSVQLETDLRERIAEAERLRSELDWLRASLRRLAAEGGAP